MPARKRRTAQTGFEDLVERSVAEFFDVHWEQWRDRFGIYGVSLERDANGDLLLALETSPQLPGVVRTVAAALPPFIDLSVPGQAAPVRLNIRRVERVPPTREQRISGGSPGAGNIAAGLATQGTLGGWAWDVTDDTLVLLSCEHVLGPKNQPVFLGPSPASHVKIGKVKRSVAYSRALPVDCAIATIDATHDPAFVVESLGPAIMMVDSQVRMNLPARKRAAVTHLRKGEVVRAERPTTMGTEFYPRLIEVKGVPSDWSQPGDSGALVFDDEVYESGLRAVIGLHLAGHQRVARNGLALRIAEVFAALELTTVPDGLLTALLVGATDSPASAKAAREAFIELYFSVDETRLTIALLKVIEDPEYLLRLTLDPAARRRASALLERLLDGGTTVAKILAHSIETADAELLGEPPEGLDSETQTALTHLVAEATSAVGKTLGETLISSPS